ncbi:hypothetical protein M3J09_007078 [Ascochyta lentis]
MECRVVVYLRGRHGRLSFSDGRLSFSDGRLSFSMVARAFLMVARASGHGRPSFKPWSPEIDRKD